MFENITKFLKKFNKKDNKVANNSREAAKERLHLVLMQDRANVSADFLELMKQEIIEVIKKYIDVDESAIDVRLTNKENADGTNGAPALYANIPILNIKNEARKITNDTKEKPEEVKEQVKPEEKNKSDKSADKKEEIKENREDKEKELEQNDEKQEEKEKKANDNEEVKQEEKVKKEKKKEVEKEKEKNKTEE